jgi:hypothetical protein
MEEEKKEGWNGHLSEVNCINKTTEEKEGA